MLAFLHWIEAIAKVSVDYYKVITDVKNKTVRCWTRLSKKNEFILVALCNGWVILDMDVMY